MSTASFHLMLVCMVAFVFALGCSDAGRIDQACRSNADCTPSQLCATGLCEGGLGVCNERPTTCPDTDRPVCGCDGLTYLSSCFAEMAGVRLAKTTGCTCADNTECVDGQFCALDDSCSNPGACRPRPQACDPSDREEVCGCDGMTYPNECEASQAGVRVSALGMCDCNTNTDCGSDEYCNAITCDGPGVCETPRDTCSSEDPEVTGCDGVVYVNECEAAMQGVRVRPES